MSLRGFATNIVLGNKSYFKACADKTMNNMCKGLDGHLYCTIDEKYKKDYNMFVLISMDPIDIDLISNDQEIYFIEKNGSPFNTGLIDLMV